MDTLSTPPVSTTDTTHPLTKALSAAHQTPAGAVADTRRTRALMPALPHWTRPLIRPIDGRLRAYAVRSASRAGLTHVVDIVHETCTCESWVYQGRDAYPLGHELRACPHIKDVQDYEREQAGVPLVALAQLASCVVCGAPATPGGLHCRVTSWGRGYCSTRAGRALDDVFGIEAL